MTKMKNEMILAVFIYLDDKPLVEVIIHQISCNLAAKNLTLRISQSNIKQLKYALENFQMQTDLLLNFLFTEDMAKKMKTMID